MIFNLFKSKPTLRDLIPKGFIDIHSHILPGIDDGAKNVEQSIKLIDNMKEMGFTKIIGTPHTYPGLYENTNESIKESFDIIHKKLPNPNIINYASEYMLDISLIEKAQKRNLLCLKNNYVLIEMSFISAPIKLYEILFEVIINGYIPVLAHPERYRFLFSDFNNFKKLKRAGCKFQINLLSLTGYYGHDILEMSNKLIKNKMIDFAGSDIHNIEHINSFQKKIKTNYIKEAQEIILSNELFS